MQIVRSTPVVICMTIFLSLSTRRIEANSENPRIRGDERLTVNLDDLVIEVEAPRGRENILNTEEFYERWRNVDDVAYWESIYGSADNIPEFEDLPEIAGETLELEYADESSVNESSNTEDNETSATDCSERTMEKKFPPSEVAVSKDRKNLSRDLCERINPFYPVRRSTVRRKREERGATREECGAAETKRVTGTLSRSKSDPGYRQRPEPYSPCDKYGRSCDRPEDDGTASRTESVRFVASAINAESELARGKRDAIDRGPVGYRRDIGLASVNNPGTDRPDEGVDSREPRIDAGLCIAGNSVLNANSGIINADTAETVDKIESAVDSETRSGTPVDNDFGEVELELAAKLKKEANGEAETASEISAESNSKLAGEQSLRGKTKVTENFTVISNEARISGEARGIPNAERSKFEKNNGVHRTEEEEEKKMDSREKSGEEIVGSTLRINCDSGAAGESHDEDDYSGDRESEDPSLERRSSSEEYDCHPMDIFSEIFNDERRLQGDGDTHLRAGEATSGPHENPGIRISLEEDQGASRFGVRDENYRNYEEQPVDSVSSEYEEYDEETFPENPREDESFSDDERESDIRVGIVTSFDAGFDVNSASRGDDDLRVGAESCPARESLLDIVSTVAVDGADPSSLRGLINWGIRADGEIGRFHDSRLGVNADGDSRAGSGLTTDLDSRSDMGRRVGQAAPVKLGERIRESAREEISDSEARSPDSRSDEAYDGRSEYPGEESPCNNVGENCSGELYGEGNDGSCPICGRFSDRPLEEHRRFSMMSGTINHFDEPIRATAEERRTTRDSRHGNHRVDLDANCTGEAASRSLDCRGMDGDLRRPRDGNAVSLRFVWSRSGHCHDIAVDVDDRARSPLAARRSHPRDHTASMLSFFHGKVPDDFVKMNEQSEIALFGTKLLRHRLSVDYNVTPNKFLEFLDNHEFRVTGEGICGGRGKRRCGAHDKFRNLDGSCNNFDNPTWGRSNGAFARILPPRYSDGIRGMPVSVTGEDLPNPRKLSVTLYSRRRNLDARLTLAVAQWGQTLAHDLARQVMDQTSKGGIECCGKNGKSHLPKSLQHHSCAPISISPRDKFYSSHGQRCMNFVRSMTVAREDCTLGPADQLNGATSFLDCSPTYGVDEATSDESREFTGGRMRVEFRSGRWMLPTATNHSNFCDIRTPDDGCYGSGDPRNNQNPQLVIVQTLLVREHNRIADALSALNLDWTDERIFQESRRIVIAEYQHITYNEWLPLVLGERYVRRHGIVRTKPGLSRVYNELVDPSTIIGFTSGAFRSLHSMVEGQIHLCDEAGDVVDNLRLSDHYFRPRIIEKGSNFEHLLRGMTTQSMQKQDIHLHTELTEYLFRSLNDYGMDLAAIDIQRGRDHGVPGYNAYRKICRLRPARDFDDLSDEISSENIERLRRVYAHVDDIDLIVGATMEKRVTGSQFGPINRCIIGEQFYRSRMGDRYFYDNEKSCHSFTPEQFEEITKVTLSRLICDTGGDVDVVQRYAFRATSLTNPPIPCEDLPKLDFQFWIE